MSADDTAAPEGDQPQTSPESVPTNETGTLHPLTDSTKAGLMERMGIPTAVRDRLKENQETMVSEQSEPEAEAGINGEVTREDIPEESDAQPEEEEPTETETEEAGEEEEDKPDENATALQKKNYKLRQQKREFRERAEKAEAELAKLKSEPEPGPTTAQATINDPLAHITDLDGLSRERKEFRILRDQARANPDGWVVNEGQNNEYVVTREQAAQWLGYAEDVLTDYFPRKEDEINKVRPASTEAARKILPTMLERGSEDHHAAQLVWKNYPMLAGHPERDYLTAIFLRGFKLTAQEIAAKAKGN
nr:hypothetical protein [Blastocatellia bacterium]